MSVSHDLGLSRRLANRDNARPTVPARGHLGSATSRSRKTDVTATHQRPKAWQICEYINMPLDIEGSQMFAVTTMGL